MLAVNEYDFPDRISELCNEKQVFIQINIGVSYWLKSYITLPLFKLQIVNIKGRLKSCSPDFLSRKVLCFFRFQYLHLGVTSLTGRYFATKHAGKV